MMPPLEPIKAVKCDYRDCFASFNTEKEMKSHKKYSNEHDYCHKCDENFDSYDDLAQHKAFRPDNHGKACRVCGEEFKSTSGLRLHIEKNHRVDQKLRCPGCGNEFYRASLLTEHLEFGHCKTVTATEFQGHIVHKYLISELLKGGHALNRFQQKIARYDAAIDQDEDDGGVAVDHNILEQDGDAVRDVSYKAIDPIIPQDSMDTPKQPGPYPPLSFTSARKGSLTSQLSSNMAGMSLGGETEYATAPSTLGGNSSSTNHRLKIWGPGRSAASRLFPDAKPTPPPSEFSIKYHDDEMDSKFGINIMRTRFWDPISEDWNPERFLDTVTCRYACPFTCEQTFDIPGDLNRHILNDHRITRMKCPSCLKYFKSCTALMCHCESRGSRCHINKADDFSIFLDRLTGGFLSVQEKTRPEFLHNPTVSVRNIETGKMELYRPPTASYLQYEATTPADWKKKAATLKIGGIPNEEPTPIRRQIPKY